MPLDELHHVQITEFRDRQLARGLRANSVRRYINMLNAMVNMAFKHLDIDRLSPFKRLYIRGEGELSLNMAPITVEHLRNVKAYLLSHPIPSRLAALIQPDTGMRISEPVLARLDDLVLDHDIPHLLVRKNSLTDRKIQASIRCLSLLGVWLEAAKELHRRAVRQKSD
jgi:integrase